MNPRPSLLLTECLPQDYLHHQQISACGFVLLVKKHTSDKAVMTKLFHCHNQSKKRIA